MQTYTIHTAQPGRTNYTRQHSQGELMANLYYTAQPGRTNGQLILYSSARENQWPTYTIQHSQGEPMANLYYTARRTNGQLILYSTARENQWPTYTIQHGELMANLYYTAQPGRTNGFHLLTLQYICTFLYGASHGFSERNKKKYSLDI